MTTAEQVKTWFPVKGARFQLEIESMRIDQGALVAVVTLVLWDEHGQILDVRQNEGPVLSGQQIASHELDRILAEWKASVLVRTVDDIAPWLPSQLMPFDYPPERRAAEEEAAYVAWKGQHASSSPEALRAALETMRARFPAVFEHVQRVYGLKLPRHLAVGAALFDVASELLDKVLWISAGALLELFEPHALERKVRSGVDERAHGRSDFDPVEKIELMGSDYLKWGIWFDDPQFVPHLVVRRDFKGGEREDPCGATVLQALRQRLDEEEDADAISPPAMSAEHVAYVTDLFYGRRLLREYLDALTTEDEEALRVDLPSHAQGARGPDLPHSPGIWVPAGVSTTSVEVGADVDEALTNGRRALANQDFVAAVAVARTVFEDETSPSYVHRSRALPLLVDAYRALGRHALAELAKLAANMTGTHANVFLDG